MNLRSYLDSTDYLREAILVKENPNNPEPSYSSKGSCNLRDISIVS